MRSLVLSLVFAAMLVGCDAMDTMVDGLKHSERVASDLEKSVGSKPFVGFNWSNGFLTDVHVNFDGIPSGMSTEQITQLSKQSITTHFQQTPKHVVISFTLPGG